MVKEFIRRYKIPPDLDLTRFDEDDSEDEETDVDEVDMVNDG